MTTVLLIDDSRTSRKILSEMLENHNFKVIGQAHNGEEGYLKYKELKPDIVTMDITMPVMDGIESLSLIRREDENAKVVMITAAGQRESMMEALKRGASDFITKPFDEAEIVATLMKIAQQE